MDLLLSWMDPRELEILQTNHVFLVENLDLTNELLKAYLVQERLLTDNDVQRLQVCYHIGHFHCIIARYCTHLLTPLWS